MKVQWNLEKDKAWVRYSLSIERPPLISVEVKKAFYAGYNAGQESCQPKPLEELLREDEK